LPFFRRDSSILRKAPAKKSASSVFWPRSEPKAVSASLSRKMATGSNRTRAKNSRWAKLAREGHDVAWEFENREGGGYTGRILIDGEIMSAKQAHERFLSG
jgi:hypothetical protein